MYTPLPTESELHGTGLTVDDYAEDIDIWPDNWSAYTVFSMLRSQWDVGFNGRTGIKYPVMFELLDRKGLCGDEWWQMFHDLREMEFSALAAMNQKKA